MDFEM